MEHFVVGGVSLQQKNMNSDRSEEGWREVREVGEVAQRQGSSSK